MSDKSQVPAEAAAASSRWWPSWASVQAFPDDEWDLRPVVTITDIFEVVQAGEVAFGVVPVENSTNGSVLFTLDNFADRNALYPDISVCGEIYLDVHHFLAWGQCVAFLQTYLKGIEAIDVSSTSRAAELVSMDETGTSAAISSEIAARMHGIDVLARTIEDREDNTTRFFIIRKGLDGKMPGHCERKRGRTKSMVSFTVPHEAPGALADVLECFRKFRLNLTSINSRPSLTGPFEYVFFVEFEGHRFQDPDGRVKGALEGVAQVAEKLRWLGSWEDQRS
uniref:Chorismate mutase prephenate dehydratase n=1 Tax=Colletotrichum fructicola (strain Nara gc5) TaxID=1213859 RepID=L2G9V9_COLFN